MVEGRYALWDRTADAPVVTGLRLDCREVLITDVMDAHPSNKYELPEPTIWPFLAAVATSIMFIGSIFTPWAVPIGAAPITITLIGWFWPKRRREDAVHGQADEAVEPAGTSEPATPREVRA